MSRADERAAEAGEEAREAHRAWLRSLGRCQCLRPVLGRVYLGDPACERCGKLVAV